MSAPSVCPAPRCVNVRPCPHHPAPAKGNSRGWHWSTVIVPAVLDRDGHRCVLCGRLCPHPRHHDVDHRDGDRTNNRMGNLRTVCAHANRGGGRCE